MAAEHLDCAFVVAQAVEAKRLEERTPLVAQLPVERRLPIRVPVHERPHIHVRAVPLLGAFNVSQIEEVAVPRRANLHAKARSRVEVQARQPEVRGSIGSGQPFPFAVY